MMMIFLIYMLCFVNLISVGLFTSPNRALMLNCWVPLRSLFGHHGSAIYLWFFTFFSFILFQSFLSNLPYSVSPVLYYIFTLTISVGLWMPIMSVVMKTQLYSFIAHMLPYGSPMFLALLLPLIEIFSNIIRPLTLMIRLSTNLSAGHIMMFMFSFFCYGGTVLSLAIFVLIFFLFLLEVMISMLQAYIFTSLSYMYLSETLVS